MDIERGGFIQEIDEVLKKARVLLGEIKKAEEALERSQEKDWREIDKINEGYQDATADLMLQLEELVKSTSALGCSNGLYELYKYHKIVKKDKRFND